jgi:hypothetical protein
MSDIIIKVDQLREQIDDSTITPDLSDAVALLDLAIDLIGQVAEFSEQDLMNVASTQHYGDTAPVRGLVLVAQVAKYVNESL